MDLPKASVIVLSWNGIAYLEACLKAVLCQDYANFDVIVVDNGSVDGSPGLVAERFPQVQLIRNERNLGFAGGNNAALRATEAEILALLNQDTEVQPGWLAALVHGLETLPDAGIAGSKILDMDGRTLQHAGGYVQHPWALGQHFGHGQQDRGQYDDPRQVEFVTGAAMAFKRQVLSDIGELDEDFYPGYFEDVDFCYRARSAGYAVWYTPEAIVHHCESTSMRRDSYLGHRYYYRSRLRFVLKHYTLSQIGQEFVPAEIERISGAPPEELRAATLSAVEGILTWALLSGERQPRPAADEFEAVVDALLRLQEAHLRLGEQAGRPPLPASHAPDKDSNDKQTEPDGKAPGQAISTIESLLSLLPNYNGGSELVQLFENERHLELRRELDELHHSWQPSPRPFTSEVAVMGPLIVAFREFVNNLATRWYVQALIEQQVAFNAGVTRLLSAQADEFEARVRQNVQSLHNLALQYGQFLGKIAHIVQQHENWLRQHNQRIYDQGQSNAFLAEQVAYLRREVLALNMRIVQLEKELHGREGTDAPQRGG
jgi:GT2 family glycosyltransferase